MKTKSVRLFLQYLRNSVILKFSQSFILGRNIFLLPRGHNLSCQDTELAINTKNAISSNFCTLCSWNSLTSGKLHEEA